MDVDYIAAKDSIEELEKLLYNQTHGEREEIADDIIEFVESMKKKWAIVKETPRPTIEEGNRIICNCGDDRDIGNSRDDGGVEYCMHCGYDIR